MGPFRESKELGGGGAHLNTLNTHPKTRCNNSKESVQQVFFFALFLIENADKIEKQLLETTPSKNLAKTDVLL